MTRPYVERGLSGLQDAEYARQWRLRILTDERLEHLLQLAQRRYVDLQREQWRREFQNDES